MKLPRLKHVVGTIARFQAATEILLEGESVFYKPKNGRYITRARRVPHGVELTTRTTSRNKHKDPHPIVPLASWLWTKGK